MQRRTILLYYACHYIQPTDYTHVMLGALAHLPLPGKLLLMKPPITGHLYRNPISSGPSTVMLSQRMPMLQPWIPLPKQLSLLWHSSQIFWYLWHQQEHPPHHLRLLWYPLQPHRYLWLHLQQPQIHHQLSLSHPLPHHLQIPQHPNQPMLSWFIFWRTYPVSCQKQPLEMSFQTKMRNYAIFSSVAALRCSVITHWSSQWIMKMGGYISICSIRRKNQERNLLRGVRGIWPMRRTWWSWQRWIG